MGQAKEEGLFTMKHSCFGPEWHSAVTFHGKGEDKFHLHHHREGVCN